MSQPLLSVNGLMMRFGGLLAVNNVNPVAYTHLNMIVSTSGLSMVFTCCISASGDIPGIREIAVVCGVLPTIR